MSQSNEDDLRYGLFLKAQTYNDSVVLRWVPGNYFSWKSANYHGVWVEKKTGYGDWVRLNVNPLKPLTLDAWKNTYDTTDIYVSTAAQMLLGKASMTHETAKSMSEKLTLAKEQQNRLSLAALAAEFSKEAGNGLAWRFVDPDIDGKSIYQYRISLAEETKVKSGQVSVLTTKKYSMGRVEGLAAENADGKVILSWPIAGNTGRYSGYIIERSANGKNYEQLNKAIIIAAVANDSINDQRYEDKIANSDVTYFYRLTGITSFADKGSPSRPVRGRSIDLTPPAPPSVFKAKAANETSVNINWQETENQPEDHAGYNIYRGVEYKGPYSLINASPLKKKVRSFIDQSPEAHRSNFYQIEAIDNEGNSARSFPVMVVLPDSTAPAQPVELIGNVDSLGVVSLAWPFGVEKDLMGYRVYRATAMDREFNQITKSPIPGNFYRDTIPINTLTEKVYYKIAAFDFNYNPSPYSEILELQRPDVVPPAAPSFKDYIVTADSVVLQWVNSPSADVVKYTLYRKEKEGYWQTLAEISHGSSSVFVDQTTMQGGVYEYQITATDDVGLESNRSFPVVAHVNDNGYRAGTPRLEGDFNKQSKSFRLNWKFTPQMPLKKVLIFKGTTKDNLQIIATVPGDQLQFEDHQFYRNESGYVYAIKALTQDGGETVFSNTINAKFSL